ncbi:MAG: hypothetical protein E7385_07505 [Ruminococcaceae bacterium]|nr:hypothetical protein [Oscillospiraceae bacterium]
MDKIIFFENEKTEQCAGENYYAFLDYAFQNTDCFMLVYVNYYNQGYSKKMKYYKNILNKYKVKSRSNPSWPGVLETYCPNTTYKIVFYKTDPEAKEILKQVDKLSAWSRPSYPEDLSFFKGNQCWFYSVGHEGIGAILHAREEDIDFVASLKLAKREDALTYDSYYDACDEELETK